ncbi:hypothetical protein E2562_022718 [Oryza meyeriana var. granulata]|uniref:Uncharacterized protein n=1 Tax=Oryza meyeriana var. granulata TaxID=110450 RepID=A0A6G1E0G2_9ORYZ|nr:hypothetical protein E2562_022718 [Oryza meyeriana var. granulata]
MHKRTQAPPLWRQRREEAVKEEPMEEGGFRYMQLAPRTAPVEMWWPDHCCWWLRGMGVACSGGGGVWIRAAVPSIDGFENWG